MAKIALAADEVFTPRSPIVNREMYVERLAQEGAILRNLGIDKNLIIHGESGSGKSWLYKKVFNQFDIGYATVNMANAARFNSLDKAFEAKFNSLKKEITTGRTVEGSASLDAGLFKAGAKSLEDIEKLSAEPFERLLEVVHDPSGKQSYLVLDNMESILGNQQIIDQISNVITLVDDEDYAKYKVRLLIVGVPHDIQSYFSQAKNYHTIANRIVEIPEVDRLPRKSSSALLKKGLCDLLGFTLSGVSVEDIAALTDDIPQYLHELGLAISYRLIGDQKVITPDVLEFAVKQWMNSSFTSDHTAIIGKMNSRSTKVGRRNQVIYAMSLFPGTDFKYRDIETIIRTEFPKSSDDKTLNISQILHELSKEPSPIIRRNPKGDAYRFISPKTKICARCTLVKMGEDRIESKLSASS